MKYIYRPKTTKDLRVISQDIWRRYPDRRYGYAIDIEGIIEDLGGDIIYRPWTYRLAEYKVKGYIPRAPNLFVVNEYDASSSTAVRASLAHEFAHRVLEGKLWAKNGSADGALTHDLTLKQHADIEKDARNLAAEILMPHAEFTRRYQHHLGEVKKRGVMEDVAIRAAVIAASRDFTVSGLSAGLRASKLGLISPATYRKCFISAL